MNRREFLNTTTAAGLASLALPATAQTPPPAAPPNFVIILLDDSGWADYKPFGHPPYPTPNIEALARQGCRFNNFYVPQAICSASRSALLSGCYPSRTKVFGAHGPGGRGLEPSYATLAEVLKPKGYRTAVFGKWHIGDQPDTRPPARGFDESCGLMYSNDMWEFHPEAPQNYPQPLHFWENGKVKVERMTPDLQPMLTTWYTEHATDFISRNKANPFLLYVPHSMPHVPHFRSEKFKGKSGVGVYGDVMMEIDWSIGEILGALKKNGLDDNTFVLLTSDNGPWTSYGNHAGQTPFRDAKGTSFDGGTRSACLMRYPGHIKPNSASTRALCTIDLLPTLAHLAQAPLPKNPIDGLNVWDLITDQPGALNPHDFYAFTTNQTFEAVISADGHWKLHVPHTYRDLVKIGNNGAPGKYRQTSIELSLFDLEKDPFETINVLEKYPEVATRLKMYVEQHRKQFFQ